MQLLLLPPTGTSAPAAATLHPHRQAPLQMGGAPGRPHLQGRQLAWTGAAARLQVGVQGSQMVGVQGSQMRGLRRVRELLSS